jgi:hypothetical protein
LRFESVFENCSAQESFGSAYGLKVMTFGRFRYRAAGKELEQNADRLGRTLPAIRIIYMHSGGISVGSDGQSAVTGIAAP